MVGRDKLGRPCRVYAPVGSHETLLAYLVRRLLENGANSSFVHQLADEMVSAEVLLASPLALAGDEALPQPLVICGRSEAALAMAARLTAAGVAFGHTDSADGRIAQAGEAVLFVTDGPLRDFEREFVGTLAAMEKRLQRAKKTLASTGQLADVTDVTAGSGHTDESIGSSVNETNIEIMIAVALVMVVIIVARFAWLFPATYLPRWLIPGLARRDPSPPWQAPIMLAFTGVRGVVSLAARFNSLLGVLEAPLRIGVLLFDSQILRHHRGDG